ncbi:unnamed protein product [Anisakis simplex]|uniref:Uncharacterized protein n=1 Tax=Anisakis simplex TaxID=6269 RepID=A0A0M3JI45_ANISI|nr:unnamed protein product [Anisakis simplex]
MGRSQGDRLLAMKVKAQHHLGSAKFSSPTTPIKPIHLKSVVATTPEKSSAKPTTSSAAITDHSGSSGGGHAGRVHAHAHTHGHHAKRLLHCTMQAVPQPVPVSALFVYAFWFFDLFILRF